MDYLMFFIIASHICTAGRSSSFVTNQEQQAQQPNGTGSGQEQPGQQSTGTVASQEQPVQLPRTGTGEAQQPTGTGTGLEQQVQQQPETSTRTGGEQQTLGLVNEGSLSKPSKFPYSKCMQIENDVICELLNIHKGDVVNSRKSEKESEHNTKVEIESGHKELMPPYSFFKYAYYFEFDFKRLVTVSKIEMKSKHVIPEGVILFDNCYYYDLDSSKNKTCDLQVIHATSHIVNVYFRNMHGRYLTIKRRPGFELSRLVSTTVYIMDPGKLGGRCYEYLGMNDGSIQDFQISASSWMPQNRPSDARLSKSGWIPSKSDEKPWIMVDLIAETTIEGIIILLGYTYKSVIVDIYAGLEKDSLHHVLKVELTDKTTSEIPKPVKARYIKSEILQINIRVPSLRFEVIGCKLSGVPALNCYKSFEIFEISSDISTVEETITHNISTKEICNNICLQNDNCRVVSYTDKGECVQYMRSYLDNWQVGTNPTGDWFAKLCVKDPVELFPTLRDESGIIVANVAYIETSSVITSIGYPFAYGQGQDYKWIVKFVENKYINIIFTNVSIDKQVNGAVSPCNLLLLRKYINSTTEGKTIDYNFNDRIFVVETGESLLILTFTTCVTVNVINSRGFRALVTEKDIPACLSIDSDVSWRDGRHEICNKPKMKLTSMSILNFPFRHEERWDIQAGEHHIVQIKVLDFYVLCPNIEAHSKFKVVDFPDKYAFCNTDRPPDIFNSKNKDVKITFLNRGDPAVRPMRKEGFRILYKTISSSLEYFVDLEESTSKADTRNVEVCGLNSINVNVTYSGKSCQRWDNLTLNATEDFRARFGNLTLPTTAFNHCKDLHLDGNLWCYTIDGNQLREPCFLNQTLEHETNGSTRTISMQQYQCGDKTVIPQINRCDGLFDCRDNSDEMYCKDVIGNHLLIDTEKGNGNQNLSTSLAIGSYYRCLSKEWISIIARCDGFIDCLDASDELNCNRTGAECNVNEFQCADGNCVYTSQVCDFIPDCTNAEDEFCEVKVCRTDEFACDNMQCIPDSKRCNAIPDCIDSSDEDSCELCRDSFHCDRNKCIQPRLRCDSFNDCVDGSDEISCVHGEISSSCEEVWELGHRKSGQYIIDDIAVDCDFSSYNSVSRKITKSILHKIAVSFEHGVTLFTRDSGSSKGLMNKEEMDMNKFRRILLKSNYECVLQVKQNCHFPESEASSFDDPHKIYNYAYCLCVVETLELEKNTYMTPVTTRNMFEINFKRVDLTRCNGTKISQERSFPKMFYTFNKKGNFNVDRRILLKRIPVQITAGPITCNYACRDFGREILILTEEALLPSDSSTAAVDLARQLYTRGSIIRLLRYNASTESERFSVNITLLEIHEEHIFPFEEIERKRECQYKSIARNVLQSIQFSGMKSKGIIFIEDSEVSSTVAKEMFSEITKPAFTIYRVFKKLNALYRSPGRYAYVKDIPVNKWKSLSSLGYKHFPEICKAGLQVPCNGGYRCSSSKQCLPLEQICDGIVHCVNGDDERLCDLKCPGKCICDGLAVKCRSAGLTEYDIRDMTINTRAGDFSQNPGIRNIFYNSSLRFPFMLRLNVSSCQIELISSDAFWDLYSLRLLDIGHNKFKVLPENVFRRLHHLTDLILDGNHELTVLSSSAFHGLRSIQSLRISGTKIKRIADGTFAGLQLKSIDISNNEIEEIEDLAFKNLSVQYIDFKDNNILKFNKLLLVDVRSLRELHTPDFKFCCILVRPWYVEEDDCYPAKNEFSSCGDLMRHPILQGMLWIVGIAALLGNFGSILYRLVYDRERLKIGYGIFVTNLAAADFLMGVYLIIIATVDSLYRKRYIYMDDQWRNSTFCVTAGILSMVSSEASVLFLCLITLDRLLVIKYPFGTIRFLPRRAHACCCISWVIALVLAVIPVFYTSYFENKFYSRSGVCVALPLTRDKPPGWVYSVVIFVGLNFCTFLLVAFGQLSIFLELRKTTSGLKKTQKSRKRDLQVARNLILVATTDFLCWFPIGLMGIMALSGHPISGDVYAWTAVFVLPLNSALNPILYTLTAIIGKRSFNPSTEEQNRTEIQTEIGIRIMQCLKISRSVRLIPVAEMRSVQDILNQDERISVVAVAAFSRQLAKFIRLLHRSCVGLEQLDEANTYISIDKSKGQKMIVFIDSKTTISTDKKLIEDNIYKYGVLLRKLIAKCNKLN